MLETARSQKTCTIVHPCLEVSVFNNVSDIPRSIFNKKQAQQAVKRQPICIYDTYHDCIIYEIERLYHINYERQIHDHDR